MPFLYTSILGRRNPEKTLTVDAYVARLDMEVLTPNTKALGFKTFVEKEPSSPFLIDEEVYIADFREQWLTAIFLVAEDYGVSMSEAMRLFDTVDPTMSSTPTIQVSEALSSGPAEANGTTTTPTEANGTTTTPTEANGTDASSEAISRQERRVAVLKKLRPPPLKHVWALWHDRHVSDTAAAPADNSNEPEYKTKLTELIEISTVQTFWETYNNFPFENLILRDSVYLFKKTVTPVWEDKRNARGGAWTLRVSKADGAEIFKYVQMMAIGEMLQEVVEPGDDICGVGLSIRFNAHLITVWNRDASNQKSVDAIMERVIDQLPDEYKPTSPANYFYKKHSEHKGFKVEPTETEPTATETTQTETELTETTETEVTE
ncbi:MAG: hypothetical protein M1816_004838 [Peltula sp. TS41687]|nr:MAG: hypothetical protein M1816_004838 [Peltula sp. TS41687]